MNDVQQKVNAWVQAKFSNPCAVCGAQRWQTHDGIFAVVQVDPDTRTLKEEGIYVVPVTCTQCKQVVLVHAEGPDVEP